MDIKGEQSARAEKAPLTIEEIWMVEWRFPAQPSRVCRA